MHGPLCDINSFAPRDYSTIPKVKYFLSCLILIYKKDVPKVGKMFYREYKDKKVHHDGWYLRSENNGWRPVMEKLWKLTLSFGNSCSTSSKRQRILLRCLRPIKSNIFTIIKLIDSRRMESINDLYYIELLYSSLKITVMLRISFDGFKRCMRKQNKRKKI